MVSDNLSRGGSGSLIAHPGLQNCHGTPCTRDLGDVEQHNGSDSALESHLPACNSGNDKTPLPSSSMSRRRRASSKPILDGHLFLPPPPTFASFSASPALTPPSPADSSLPVSLNVLSFGSMLNSAPRVPSTPMDQVCNGHNTPPDAPRQPATKRPRVSLTVATKFPRYDGKATTGNRSTTQNEQVSPGLFSVVPNQSRRPSLDALGPLRRKLLSGLPRRLSYGRSPGSPSITSANTSSSSDSLASPVILEAPQAYLPKRAIQAMHSPMSPKNLIPLVDCTDSPSYFTFAYR